MPRKHLLARSTSGCSSTFLLTDDTRRSMSSLAVLFLGLITPKTLIHSCFLDYDINRCLHKDVEIRNIPQASCDQYYQNLHYLILLPNETQYCLQCLKTGISKPSIFSGLDPYFTLGLPKLAVHDLITRIHGHGRYYKVMFGRGMENPLQTPYISCQAPLNGHLGISQRSLQVGTRPGSSSCIYKA